MLAKQFGFEPPREKGMNTVEAFEAMIDGKVSAVINLGGNLVRSVPDRDRIEPAWRKLPLTVNITTKLNRSHLVHGEKSYVLPCLSRIEIDTQEAVSMEDSTGCIHGSRGVTPPAAPDIRSSRSSWCRWQSTRSAHVPPIDWDRWVGVRHRAR